MQIFFNVRQEIGKMALFFVIFSLFIGVNMALVKPTNAAVQIIAAGIVTYPDGNPVQNHEVELHNGDSSIRTTANTDASGTYSFSYEENNLHEQDMRLETRPPAGYFKPDNSIYNFTYHIGDVVQTVNFMFLAAPKTINITVKNEQGQQVNAQAYVQAANIWQRQQSMSLNSDPVGQGTMNVPGGKWFVTVDANLGSSTASEYPWMYTGKMQVALFAENTTAESANLTFYVTTANSKVSVKVLDVNGNILTGNSFRADIQFTRSDGIGTRRKINEQGTAELYLLPGIYTLWAYHPSITENQTLNINSFVVKEGEDLNLGTVQTILKGSTITGTIKDSSGNAVGGVNLLLTKENSPERTIDYTQEDGSYSFSVGPGKYSIGLVGSASYYLESIATVDVATNSETVSGVNLTATFLDMIISGTVMENGAAVENFNGTVIAESTDGKSTYYGSISSDGTYEIDIPTSEVTSNNLVLDVITQADMDSYLAETVSVPVGGDDDVSQNLSLSAETAVIIGNIEDMAGSEVADLGSDAEVIAMSTSGSMEKASVQADGSYSMTVAPGEWILGVKLDDEEDAEVITPAGNYEEIKAKAETTKEADLAVYEKEATVSGTITDSDGNTVASAPVIITNEEDLYVSTSTDASGNYVAEIPVGTYSVTVGSTPDMEDQIEPESEEITVSSDAAETADLSYREAETTISGTVSTKNGELSQAKVAAFSDEGGYVEAEANDNGDYSLELTNGNWNIIASGLAGNDLYSSTEKSITVSDDSADADITLKKTGEEVPSVASVTEDTSELIVVGNSEGVNAIVEPFSAALSGEISVDLIPVPEILPTSSGVQASVGYEVEITADSKEITQLYQPVTITMPISETGVVNNYSVDEDQLAAQYWSPDEETWQTGGVTGVIDTESNKMIMQVDHLTRFSATSKLYALPKKIKGVKAPKQYIQARQAKLMWHKAKHAKKYQVKLLNRKGKTLKMFTIKKHSLVVKEKWLKADRIYRFRVRGLNKVHVPGEWSKKVKFKTLTQ